MAILDQYGNPIPPPPPPPTPPPGTPDPPDDDDKEIEWNQEAITQAIDNALGRSGSYERTLQEFYSPTFAIVGTIEKTLAAVMTGVKDGKAITKELDAIAKTMGADTFEELTEAVKDDPEKREELEKTRQSVIKKHDADNRKKLGAVFGIPISKLGSLVTATIAAAFDMQNKFLQLNTTLPKIFDKFGKDLDSLPGDMQTNLQTLFEFQREGLRDAGRSTLFLANRMALTGQNVGALINVQKQLLIQGRMSVVARENFSARLTDLGNSYGVSTEKLLEGFGELRESLSVLSLGGTMGAVGGAVTELGAQFPALSQTIGSFTDKMITADIGQLGILGGMKGVGELTSSLSTDAGDLRSVISEIAAGARKFTSGFRNAGLVSQRAIKNIIGDLGVMAIQLDDAFGVAAEKMSAFDQIAIDFKTAFNTAIEPFQQGLADSVIALATFTANLAKVLPGSGDKTGEKIGIGITAGILGKLLFSPLRSLLTPLLGLLPGIAGALAPVLAPILAIGAVIGGAWWLFSSIKDSNDEAARAAEETAANTKSLVDIEKKKDLQTFGTSRFERLATKALEGNIFRVAMSEAVTTRAIVDGFESNAALLTALVEAGFLPAPLPEAR